MTTAKHKWLIEQALKVHNEIDGNLEEWLKRIDKQYKRIFSALIKELKKIIRDEQLGKITRDRLEERYSVLVMQAQQRATEIGIQLVEEMPTKLAQYSNLSYEHMNEILSKAKTVASLPVYAIEFAAGFRYEEYNFQSSVYRSGIRLGDNLNNILSTGLSQGWNMREYTKELRRVSDFTVYEVKRIARTETARVTTEGAKRSFKDYNVERVEWLATLEKRTCARCAALHTKKFRLGQEPPLPLHPHCRCVLIPVIDGYE